MTQTTLSRRGQSFLTEPEFLQMYRKYLWDNAFDPKTNPGGCISLAAAETVVFSDLLEAKLNEIRSTKVTPATFGYGRFVGYKRFCHALAGFFTNFILHGKADGDENDGFLQEPELDADRFVVTNGAGTAMETLVACLCDPGDLILVPAPMYHGLIVDFEKRFQGKLLPAPMKRNPETGDYAIDFAGLDAAFEAHSLHRDPARGKIRAFLHCNPHNPTGLVFDQEVTERLIAWCVSRKIHFMSDEVYALSALKTPGVQGPKFVSALKVCREAEKAGKGTWVGSYRQFVHLIYSFSKDLGLNGYRTGVIYTENQELLGALDSTAYFTSIPSEMQITLAQLLEDLSFMRKLIRTNNARTTALYHRLTALLNSKGIKTYRSGAGMFIWLDLLGALGKRDPSPQKKTLRQQEDEVWEKMLQGGVCLLPSYVFQPEADGWFRLCFTTMKEEHVLEGIRRLLISLFGPESKL